MDFETPGIELAESRTDIDTFDVEFSGATATIAFYPNEMTMDWGEELHKAREDIEMSLTLIGEVLHDWNIHDNGEKIPVSADGLRKLPSSLLTRIMEGCYREAEKRAVLVTPRAERRRGSFWGRTLNEVFGDDETEGPERGG